MARKAAFRVGDKIASGDLLGYVTKIDADGIFIRWINVSGSSVLGFKTANARCSVIERAPS